MSLENQEKSQSQENLEDLVQELSQKLTLHRKVAEWLANGVDVGMSSECIAFTLAFDIIPPRKSYPNDVSDFRRCFTLLNKVPELREHFQKMAEVSPIWKNLVEHWDELETFYKEEQGRGRCPKTYELLKSLIENDPNVIRISKGVSIVIGR
jgi:hypothetical protein